MAELRFELRPASGLRPGCGFVEKRYTVIVQPVRNFATRGMGGRECNSPLPLGLRPKLQVSMKAWGICC